MTSGGGRLGDVAARLDAERFVGRRQALTRVEAAMGGAAVRVLYVHGPAGVGKSALLRAMERQAGAAGREVVHVDGRVVPPVPDALAAALAPVGESSGPCLVAIDEVDDLGPLRFELRELITHLPAATVVVLAGRHAPGQEWFDGALEHVTGEVRLRPLDNAEARELLERHGVTDAAEVTAILTWARGYPLALTVAASTRAVATGEEAVALGASPGAPEQGLDEVILSRLAGHELDDLDPDVLDVAGVAAVVDARLLAAVLPSRPTRAGLKQLRELSVSEPVGNRITLHRLVRAAVRARLRETDPERYRTLVVRVADHLRTKALTDDPRAVLELIDLIEDPSSRSGYGPSATHYIDRPRPGDAEQVGAHIGALGTEWFARFTRWLEECPEQVILVRDATGSVAAIGIAYSVDRIPDWAADHIEVAPVVEHLRSIGAEHRCALIHDVHLLHDPLDEAGFAEAVRVGNSGGFAISGIANPRYLAATAQVIRTNDGSEAWGYAEVESLRRGDHERQLVTTMADFGELGVVGGLHAMIRAEQFGDQGDALPSGRGADLITALRAFHDDDVLAVGALGSGEGPARVSSARAELRAAIDAAFGTSEVDRTLRRALERTYLEPDGGHAVARKELFMSRSSFYRHLQKARDRLVERAG